MMHEPLARKLRVLRAARGITLREAEELTGVTRETLGALEHGQRGAYTNTLQKIAEGYGITVGELLEESIPVPLTKPPRGEEESGPAPTQEETLMSSTDVDDWMIEHGHMDTEKFLDEAEELASVEEIERAITKLHETRDSLLDDLRNPEVRARLFPRRSGLATKEEREREALKPARLAWKLGWEIRREYTARELGLVNYSRALFTEGETDDYLVREQDPTSEYVRERHERMVEARQAAARELEESYAKALAL